MDLTIEGYKLKNLASINILLGKNGCGKSRILRKCDETREDWTHVKYITPERGGRTIYDSNIEQGMHSNPNWLDQTRRGNHDEQFRQKSMAQLKNFEHLVNRRIANNEYIRKETNEKFDDTLVQINSLLDNVQLKFSDKFLPDFIGQDDKNPRNSEELSSGEKELITLVH